MQSNIVYEAFIFKIRKDFPKCNPEGGIKKVKMEKFVWLERSET